MGYECKADCGSPNVHRSDVPDAILMLANRVVAIDRLERRTHLLALCQEGDTTGERWLAEAETIAEEILAEQTQTPLGPSIDAAIVDLTADPLTFRCGRGQYLADIARCQAALTAGESYEVCLTDQIHTDASPAPWDLYKLLRKRNPAPFAAYLRLGEVSVLSSSPERFLSVDRERRVEACPIKGAAPRSPDPRQDEITGVLEREHTPVQCVRACFPGGSMTGAPKLPTMGIIDEIEREARGVYSGAIGYFGLEGSVDLNIVIRTIVMRPGATTIGAGGAIVMQSNPEEEFDEIPLKARAPMSTIARAVTGSEASETWQIELEPDTVSAGAR